MIGALHRLVVPCCSFFFSFRWVDSPSPYFACRNAIKVENIASTQVGHIPKAVAGKLSPLLDQGLVSVEGAVRQHTPRPKIQLLPQA